MIDVTGRSYGIVDWYSESYGFDAWGRQMDRFQRVVYRVFGAPKEKKGETSNAYAKGVIIRGLSY